MNYGKLKHFKIRLSFFKTKALDKGHIRVRIRG